VALSSDGNTALVGGANDNNGAGAAWVFTRSGGVWSQQGSKLVGTRASGAALQGSSVALSAGHRFEELIDELTSNGLVFEGAIRRSHFGRRHQPAVVTCIAVTMECGI
jgi:hypothetical protein